MIVSGRPINSGCIVLIAAAGLVVLVMVVIGYRNATAAPIVRRLSVEVPGYPPGAAPIRIALLSDMHVRGPDMPPERLARTVAQINALHPDIDVIAGDFLGRSWIGTQYSLAEAIAPFRGLRAKLGVYAVLGNNDLRPLESDNTLEQAGIHVLLNEARQVGPLAIGGIDGRLAHSQPALDDARHRTYDELERTPGIKVLLGHRPDEFVAAPPFVSIVLAGHTHCGQIVLPLVGALETGSDYGRKYACGVVQEGSKVLVVTAGLGTSHLPLRIGAPSDIWLISIQGDRRQPIPLAN